MSSNAELEAHEVAKRIEALLENGSKNDGSALQPGDIAILLRSAKGRAQLFAEALQKRGIRAEITDSTDLFLAPTVLLALSLLNAIDNPRKDVYLTGVMCSPLFRFTPDDLLEYKRGADERTLYDSLIAYEGDDRDRVEKFLATLRSYRSFAEGREVDKLLSYLYENTGLLALSATVGDEENLLLFYQYARSFEASSFRGLYAFISYINRLIEKGTRFEGKREIVSDPETVKILTVHSSKGLEYPVVFLSGAGSAITDKDSRGKIAYAEDFGISMRLCDKNGLLKVENPVHQAILDRRASLVFEEELRILYVALTRAREQLYFTGLAPTALDKFRAAIDSKRAHLDEYTARGLRSYLEVALVALPLPNAEFIPFDEETTGTLSQSTETEERADAENSYDSERRERLASLFYDRLSFAYPYEAMTNLPEKLSVSKLSPTVLDGAEDFSPESLNTTKIKTNVCKLPSFYDGVSKNDASLRGIATHTFMQFFDIDSLLSTGVESELQRLVEKGFLSEADAKLVRIDELRRFLRSDLLHRMKMAKHLYRELRFHIRARAGDLTSNEEQKVAFGDERVLVQGVIDCILEDEDGSLTLIDYKTDRLTKEELSDPRLAGKTLFAKHGEQLRYYTIAIREMFGKAPRSVELYSLPLGTSCIWEESR